jgi:signal-transduction protein with cAMP-binding, CBS, and nucleotidyltransferase domain
METDDRKAMVQTIMTPVPLETAPASKSAFDIAQQMDKAQRGAIVIVDDKGRPVGIITERDVVRKVVAQGRDPNRIAAEEIMSKPLVSIDPEVNIYDAALVMTKYKIRRLPIVRDNVLHGIVTATDLARRLYEKNKRDPTLQAMSRFALIEHA